jgi:hypothetical protein
MIVSCSCCFLLFQYPADFVSSQEYVGFTVVFPISAFADIQPPIRHPVSGGHIHWRPLQRMTPTALRTPIAPVPPSGSRCNHRSAARGRTPVRWDYNAAFADSALGIGQNQDMIAVRLDNHFTHKKGWRQTGHRMYRVAEFAVVSRSIISSVSDF